MFSPSVQSSPGVLPEHFLDESVHSDKNGPRTKTHFTAEGEITSESLPFIPNNQPSESFNKNDHIKLYMGGVFITDDFYRYKMPRLQGKETGIKSVGVNMFTIATALDRHPTYIAKYFGCELGAQTQWDIKNERYIVNGNHDGAKMQDLLEGLIKKFVLCEQCNNPDKMLDMHDGGAQECVIGPRHFIFLERMAYLDTLSGNLYLHGFYIKNKFIVDTTNSLNLSEVLKTLDMIKKIDHVQGLEY